MRPCVKLWGIQAADGLASLAVSFPTFAGHRYRLEGRAAPQSTKRKIDRPLCGYATSTINALSSSAKDELGPHGQLAAGGTSIHGDSTTPPPKKQKLTVIAEPHVNKTILPQRLGEKGFPCSSIGGALLGKGMSLYLCEPPAGLLRPRGPQIHDATLGNWQPFNPQAATLQVLLVTLGKCGNH